MRRFMYRVGEASVFQWKFWALLMILWAIFGCAQIQQPTAEPRYPEYDKWWTQSVNTNSFEGLGQGDVYVHEFITTNIVIGAGSLRREIVTNRTEAVLL